MLSFYLAHTLDRAEAKESAINSAMEKITYPNSESLQPIDETAEPDTIDNEIVKPVEAEVSENITAGDLIDGTVSDEGPSARAENAWIGRTSYTASDLRAWRDHEQLNQRDVARLFGVSPRVFSTWERGQTPHDFSMRFRWVLCGFYNLNPYNFQPYDRDSGGAVSRSGRPAPLELRMRQGTYDMNGAQRTIVIGNAKLAPPKAKTIIAISALVLLLLGGIINYKWLSKKYKLLFTTACTERALTPKELTLVEGKPVFSDVSDGNLFIDFYNGNEHTSVTHGKITFAQSGGKTRTYSFDGSIPPLTTQLAEIKVIVDDKENKRIRVAYCRGVWLRELTSNKNKQTSSTQEVLWP